MVFPGDGGGVHRPIGLGKRRQAAHAYMTKLTLETPHPNRHDQRRGGGDVTVIIGQGFQAVRMLAIGAVFRRRNLLMKVLFDILFRGQ